MKSGRQSYLFDRRPIIICAFGASGPKEGKGPLSGYFDKIFGDDRMGEDSYEWAEREMHYYAIHSAIKKAGLDIDSVDCMLAGDLLNQIVPSTFSARELGIPYMGLYNACSTFSECLIMGSFMINSGNMHYITCSTSSHFSSAERLYRYPLELGTQMTPTAQWTVTGSGCVVLSDSGEGILIDGVTIGRVVDYGITDTNNMGAAMAPACADTIKAHLADTGRNIDYYDAIITGDLGIFGSRMLVELLQDDGIDISNIHYDCGKMIFSEEQKVKMGGSGAGCSSLVFSTYFYRKLKSGEIKRALFLPTGALMSKDSSLQGETIPCISHAVSLIGGN